MAAIFKSSLQNLSPLPPRLKVKSTDLDLHLYGKSEDTFEPSTITCHTATSTASAPARPQEISVDRLWVQWFLLSDAQIFNRSILREKIENVSLGLPEPELLGESTDLAISWT